MGDIRVRFADRGDLEFVSQDGYTPIDVVARKIDQSEVVVAEVGGQAAGYLRLEYLWSMIPYIALITVRPSFRRRGIGQSMLRFLEEFLVGQGHQWLYSSSQVDEAEPQAWHRHVGFQDCGILVGINEGGISEIFFRKKID